MCIEVLSSAITLESLRSSLQYFLFFFFFNSIHVQECSLSEWCLRESWVFLCLLTTNGGQRNKVNNNKKKFSGKKPGKKKKKNHQTTRLSYRRTKAVLGQRSMMVGGDKSVFCQGEPLRPSVCQPTHLSSHPALNGVSLEQSLNSLVLADFKGT